MVNKKIYLFKDIVRLISCCLIFFSCSKSEDNKEATTDNVNQFIELSPYGLNIAKVSNEEESYSFDITVKRIGVNTSSSLTGSLIPWNENELTNYNKEKDTNYQLLPADYYNITPTNILLEPGSNETQIRINFNPSRVFSIIKENLIGEFVIPLRLESDNAKTTSSRRDILIVVSLNYPKISFASDRVISINLNQDITHVEIPTKFEYEVDGDLCESPWNFTCQLTVPDNAQTLVTQYNEDNNSQYTLLPEDSYELKDEILYQVSDIQVSGNLSVSRSLLSTEKYLLPLTIGNCSNKNILCDNQILYVSFSQTYSNPVLAESHADPTVIRADDGFFYLYSTESGGINDGMGIYRSSNLVEWEWAGQVLHNKFPSWSVKSEYDLWAPEIRKIGGQYVIYYSVAKWGETQKCKIGVANAPSPTGPFYDKGEPLITYEESGVDNCIDPFFWEEGDKKYLFWGSFKGIYVTELTDDGMSVKKDTDGKAIFQQQVAGKAFEATCIYKKGNYYYLFASVGSCCEGANSTYRVVVGRSADLFGPYVNKNGGKMLNNQYELVLQGNSLWAGPGHNSQIVLDDAGTEWMIYHNYQKNDPDLGRLLMLDRLQWTDDGWPYILKKEPSEQEVRPTIH